MDLAQFEAILGALGECVRRRLPGPIIVAGDFNAKSALWGSPVTDHRGRVLEAWAAELDLCVLNTGSTHTCVRPRGGSVIDITWANPLAARLTHGWRVATETETLSDHLYIEMEVSVVPPAVLARRQEAEARSPRWAVRKLDEDRFMAALTVSGWRATPPEERRDVETQVAEIRGAMKDACDVAMPRVVASTRRAAYWWTEEIAELRRSSVRSRRVWKRARRGRGEVPEDEARESYRAARSALAKAIWAAKERSWEELLQTLQEDPWGRPYKLVMNRLKPRTSPTTEAMDPRFLEKVVDTLFPAGEEGWEEVFRAAGSADDWSEELRVTPEELQAAVKKMKKGKAPGLDGIPGRAWSLAAGELSGRLADLFTDCLRAGRFPTEWKVAKLVLLPKEGKPADSPSAYRPICLLGEDSKMFERIIAERLLQHLSRNGPNIFRDQYGFRAGMSTIDALDCIKSRVEAIWREGGVLLGTSFDITNAFNSLPWPVIGRALLYHNVPPYLIRAIFDYFRDRKLAYMDQNGVWRVRLITRGVPQGSVLGPLLWLLGYDSVLRLALPPGSWVTGYADDTFLGVEGETWEEARVLANVAVACVVRAIKGLGLRVAPQKTQAAYFYNRRLSGKPPEGKSLMVEGVRVPIGTELKLLGLWLDGTLSFGEHIARTAPRARAAANSLCRLMPNLRGVGNSARRLYAGVVHSIALYGAPIWAPKMMATESLKKPMRGVQRLVAIRVARGYRTISHAAASTLACLPPMELLADKYAYVFWRTRELQGRGVVITARVRAAIRQEAATALLEKWEEYLNNPTLWGRRVVSAVQPVLKDWIERRGRGLTFHVTQVLTGHGCFGEYLCRIGREQTTRCHHCIEEMDSAQHTLEYCPAWAEERRVLRASTGEDLSLPAIVAAMVGSEEKWRAMAKFCGTVMAAKEEAERVRRGEQPAQPDPEESEEEGDRDEGVFRRPRGLPPRSRARWRPPLRARTQPLVDPTVVG